jgi:hypothetical protein
LAWDAMRRLGTVSSCIIKFSNEITSVWLGKEEKGALRDAREWREFAFVAPGQLFILMFIRNGFLVCAHASYANFSIFAPRATCDFGFCIITGT